MILPELSNAVFRFVLRCAGAEIDGGGVFKHPPPIRWWKIQRPIRARVNARRHMGSHANLKDARQNHSSGAGRQKLEKTPDIIRMGFVTQPKPTAQHCVQILVFLGVREENWGINKNGKLRVI